MPQHLPRRPPIFSCLPEPHSTIPPQPSPLRLSLTSRHRAQSAVQIWQTCGLKHTQAAVGSWIVSLIQPVGRQFLKSVTDVCCGQIAVLAACYRQWLCLSDDLTLSQWADMGTDIWYVRLHGKLAHDTVQPDIYIERHIGETIHEFNQQIVGWCHLNAGTRSRLNTVMCEHTSGADNSSREGFVSTCVRNVRYCVGSSCVVRGRAIEGPCGGYYLRPKLVIIAQ